MQSTERKAFRVEFRTELMLQDAEMRRLGLLLRMVRRPWNTSSWWSDGSTFSVDASEDAFFFQDVQSHDDFREVQDRLFADKQRIAQLLTFDWERTNAVATRVVSVVAGWSKVDRQLMEIRTRLLTATTEEQIQSVGLLCRETLISLAEAAHDPQRHPVSHEGKVSPTDAKRRLEAFFATELSGEANAEARVHAGAAVSFANAVVHMRTVDFRATALCAEATASVVSLAAIIERAHA